MTREWTVPASTIDDATALMIYKDWVGTVNALWTIYAGAAAAFGTAATKVPDIRQKNMVAAGLAVLFLVFSGGNAYALYRAQSVCNAIADMLERRATAYGQQRDYRALLTSIKPTPATGVVVFQIVLSLMIAVAIFLLARSVN